MVAHFCGISLSVNLTSSCDQTEVLVSSIQKLQMTVLTVFAMDYLEVLDGGLGDPAVEVEHMRGSFVVPHRRFIVKLDQIFHPSILVPYQQAVTFLHRIGKT